ncbi:hypothetical protein ACTEVG_001373 [Escherichia coli]
MKQPDFAKWYFYQLLKDYEGEQLYLNELGYVYGNEEKTNEIVKKTIRVMSLRFLKKRWLMN